MGTPSKRRKLNDNSKSSPTPGRNLDFFFGKQAQRAAPETSYNGSGSTDNRPEEGSELTDEQLARKLQAEWDEESKGAVKNEEIGPENGTASDSLPFPDRKPINADHGRDGGAATRQIEMSEATQGLGDSRLDMLQEMYGEPIRSVPEPSGPKTLSLQSVGSAEDTITSTIPFDESPLIFEPSKYVADLQGHWETEGGNATYALLTRCFVLVNSTQSRIKIVDTLVNFLRVIIEGDPSSLLPTVRTIYYRARLSNLLRGVYHQFFSNRCPYPPSAHY